MAALKAMDEVGGWKDSFFAQVARQMNGKPLDTLKGTAQPWRVNFIGEEGIDQGGPYNESATSMAKDLEASTGTYYCLPSTVCP
jgi:hypothetical protein